MSKWFAVLGVAVLVVFTGVSWSVASPLSVQRANRAVAAGAAAALDGDVVLPAGSSEVSSEPADDGGQLARPDAFLFYAALVDLPRFWTTSASPADALGYIEAHLPANASWVSSATSGYQYAATYAFPAPDRGVIREQQLVLEAAPLGNGSTGVRADAEVVYFAPRLGAQQIPRSARLLQIRMTDARGRRLLALTIKRRSVIRHVARLIDALPFAGDGGFPDVTLKCPSPAGYPLDTFTFRARLAGPVLATLSEPDSTPTMAGPCDPTELSIRGRSEPTLLDGGELLRQAGHLLRVKLAHT